VSEPILGIDLGTTNSVVAVADERGVPRVLPDERGLKVQPSVVAFHPNEMVLVGEAAKQRRVIDPQNTVYSAKRLIGRTFSSYEVVATRARMPFQIRQGPNDQPLINTRAGTFAIPEISAFVLDHLQGIAQRSLHLQRPPTQAIIAVPANFNELQRSATLDAGSIAGLDVIRVLNEPTAAALAYGHRKKLNKTIAVYDFGGGTFDISILRLHDQIFEVIGTSGDSYLGGDDIDDRLVDYFADHFLRTHRFDLRGEVQTMMRLRNIAEVVKIALSTQAKRSVSVAEIAYGPGGKSLNLELEITRPKLLELMRDIVDRTFPVCEEAMLMGGVRPADVDDVILVGGSTKIPYVRERVADFFRQAPRADVDPDTAVAIGAGLTAAAAAAAQVARRPRQPAFSEEVTTVAERPDDTLADDTVVRPKPPPPPPSARRTIAAHPPPPRQAGGDAIGRVKLRGSTAVPISEINPPAKGAVKEVGRPGAIAQPKASPSAKTMVPSDLPDLQEESVADTFSDLLDSQQRTAIRDVPGPTILEVTPHSLGIGTVGGYCEHLIQRGSRLPYKKARVFINSQDGQLAVRIRVCQGESRRLAENVLLGDLVLEGLIPRRRGETKIEVTFEIDPNGLLLVRARDLGTGKIQQATLNLVGTQSPDEVAASRQRMQAIPR
jgi:molecular chaperone DnaK